MNDMKKKNIILSIVVIMAGLMIAGGTYAYLNITVNTTNNVYNATSLCFLIDYNINNTDNSQDISGTLFPSDTIAAGLNGRVGIKIDSQCTLSGLGSLKLHINSDTSTKLTTQASSYCADRTTLEPIEGITTEAACHAEEVKGRWYGYGDPFCESTTTYERLDYIQSECASNGGTWKTSSSPLKYAVFANPDPTRKPISKGYITTSDIGHDITIYDSFTIDDVQHYYYVYIWLDGYLTDKTYTELPFSGYIKAEATQAEMTYTVNLRDTNIENNNVIQSGTAIPSNIIQYSSPAEAMSAFNNNPFFLRHRIQNGIVAESYVGFVITPQMVTDNPGVIAGTYYLISNINSNATAYEVNYATLMSAFGNSYCNVIGAGTYCDITGLKVILAAFGSTIASRSVDGHTNRCDENAGAAECWILGT